MIKKLYCIFDSATENWKSPIAVNHQGEVLRWWIEMVNNPQTEMGKHPQDFSIFEVGSFDDSKCVFNILKVPTRLATALEHYKASGPVPSTVDLTKK